jgi:hypothetical protein
MASAKKLIFVLCQGKICENTGGPLLYGHNCCHLSTCRCDRYSTLSFMKRSRGIPLLSSVVDVGRKGRRTILCRPATRVACAANCRCRRHPQCKSRSTVRLELRQPMTPTLPVGKRRFRHAAVLRAALGQALTCQHLHNCATATKAQGHAKNLNRRIGCAPSARGTPSATGCRIQRDKPSVATHNSAETYLPDEATD